MAERTARFIERENFIAATNARSDIGYKVAHNLFSDMTADEIAYRFDRLP